MSFVSNVIEKQRNNEREQKFFIWVWSDWSFSVCARIFSGVGGQRKVTRFFYFGFRVTGFFSMSLFFDEFLYVIHFQ